MLTFNQSENDKQANFNVNPNFHWLVVSNTQFVTGKSSLKS